MTRPLCAAMALLLAASASAPASAQAPAVTVVPVAEAAVSPQRLALAKQLVALLDVKGQMLQPMRRMQEQMRSGAAVSQQLDASPRTRLERSKNPAKWDAVTKRIGAIQAEAIQRILDDMAPKVEAHAIASHARHFTESELRGLIEFYGTPLGKRLAENSSVIALESVAFVQSTVAPRVAQEMKSIQPQVQVELNRLTPAGK